MSAEIPYTVRSSRKAKRVLLTIDPRQGLVVVLPARLDPGCIPNILREKRAWIEKHRDSILQAAARNRSRDLVPDRVRLRALGTQLKVQLHTNGDSMVSLREVGAEVLEISGPKRIDPGEAAALLQQWLKHKARAVLPGWLDHLAKRYGLRYSRVSIRCQKTRWGSCSSKKTISLNSKLLFLPPRLVEHVLTHELCHTLQPNHSPAFWDLFQQLQPEAPACHRRLKRLRPEIIPAWADSSSSSVNTVPDNSLGIHQVDEHFIPGTWKPRPER